MPLYRYSCPQGHEIEAIRQRDVAVISCSCGAAAARQAVNRVAVIGQASIPRGERNYRKSYGEYREALSEVVDHNESLRKNGEHVREPDYYEAARAQAIAKGAPIR